jgi:putative tricarboxylic transport membrane protein
VIGDLLNGFATALSPWNLLLAGLGVTLGTLVGVLPGIGPALTVALLLPLTYSFDATGALIMFAGIYYGAMYGGSTIAILLNTPGETASIATTIEGYAMAKSGRAAAALTTAVMGSFVAGWPGSHYCFNRRTTLPSRYWRLPASRRSWGGRSCAGC